MTDRQLWGERMGLGAAEEGDGRYKPWVTGQAGFARDLMLVPAPGSGEVIRFEPYMQAITLELDETATRLGLMCHTSGQIIFIEGKGLDDLAAQISAKRVTSVHVWTAEAGEKPNEAIVTNIIFQHSIEEIALRRS